MKAKVQYGTIYWGEIAINTYQCNNVVHACNSQKLRHQNVPQLIACSIASNGSCLVYGMCTHVIHCHCTESDTEIRCTNHTHACAELLNVSNRRSIHIRLQPNPLEFTAIGAVAVADPGGGRGGHAPPAL